LGLNSIKFAKELFSLPYQQEKNSSKEREKAQELFSLWATKSVIHREDKTDRICAFVWHTLLAQALQFSFSVPPI
jgi:hypothetical protein